jgi:hypothetical protein
MVLIQSTVKLIILELFSVLVNDLHRLARWASGLPHALPQIPACPVKGRYDTI